MIIIYKILILFLFSDTIITMALMKAALVWERFILKDLTTFARYAKVPMLVSSCLIPLVMQVELTPPGPGDMGGLVRGVGGLVKDAVTFKWTQVCHANYFVRKPIIWTDVPGHYEGGCCQHRRGR